MEMIGVSLGLAGVVFAIIGVVGALGALNKTLNEILRKMRD